MEVDQALEENHALLPFDIVNATLENDASYVKYVKDLSHLADSYHLDIVSLQTALQIESQEIGDEELLNNLIHEIFLCCSKTKDEKLFSDYLKSLSELSQSDNNYLPRSILNGLISLLVDNVFSKYSPQICKIIIISNYDLTNRDVRILSGLLKNDNSNCIISLLLDKNKLEEQAIDAIAKSVIDKNDVVSKEQLLIIAKESEYNVNLKILTFPKLLELFKKSNDINYLSQILSVTSDHSFLNPISIEIKSNLESLSQLLITAKKIKELKKNLSPENFKTTINELKEQFLNKEYLTTKSWYQFLFNQVAENSHGHEDTIKAVNSVQVSLIKTLLHKVAIDREQIRLYEAYLTNITTTSYFGRVFHDMLATNSKICALFLQQGYSLNLEPIEALLTTINNQKIQDPKFFDIIVALINTLTAQGELSNKMLQCSVSILKNFINIQNIPISTANNIIFTFGNLAKDSLVHEEIRDDIYVKHLKDTLFDTLTNAICIKYLNKNIFDTNKILEGLERVVAKTGYLSNTSIIQLLQDFTKNKDHEEDLRLKAIKILEGVCMRLCPSDMNVISRLFKEAAQKAASNDLQEYNIERAVLTLINKYAITGARVVEETIENLTLLITHPLLSEPALSILSIVVLKTPEILNPQIIAKINENPNIINNAQLVLQNYLQQTQTQEDTNNKGESVLLDNRLSNDEPVNDVEENKGYTLLQKTIALNPELTDKLRCNYEVMVKIYEAYKDYISLSAREITAKSLAFKDGRGTSTCNNSRNILTEDIVELVCLVQKANNLHTAAKGKEQTLRETQITSLLLLLEDSGIAIDTNNNENAINNKGKLLQISTGEGKSTTAASLSAIYALCGYKVDLVTSSNVLAKIGYESSKEFFKILGLTCSVNTKKTNPGKVKACYDADIVYGDALSYQADFLSNVSGYGGMRGAREFSIVIVDEVDSMLIDGSNRSARQSTPVPLMEYLLPVITISLNQFNQMILPLDLPDEQIIEAATQIISNLIEQLPIPDHLLDHTKFMAPYWAQSLVRAMCYLELDKDYVININEEGYKIINPVDNSTGVTQENTIWQNGLHQYIQAKHNCRLTPEGLSGFFITNISYFLKYEKILGMSGTLGSKPSQEFLKTIYGVSLAYIPTYKDKQLIELEPELYENDYAYKNAVITAAHQEAAINKRAVLIVCSTIKEVEYFCDRLEKESQSIKIIKYARSEQNLYNNKIEELVTPGTIIVATNLAGRGTDVRTSKEVEENGGLHVISTFIAKNARDEEQIRGRTARQGNKGTHQLIVLEEDTAEFIEGGLSTHLQIIAIKKLIRDDAEKKAIEHSITKSIPKYLKTDELYNEFSKLYLELSAHACRQGKPSPKISQLIEDWGLWLKMNNLEDEQNETLEPDINNFIANARAKYEKEEFTNPTYITSIYCVLEGRLALKALAPIVNMPGIYNFAADYYTARSYIDLGSLDENYKNEAIGALSSAGYKINEIISYLMFMSISVAENIQGNELIKQITNKIEFFKILLHQIEGAAEIIATSEDKNIRTKIAKTKQELVPALTKQDLKELEILGIGTIYELESYKPKEKWGGTIFAGCASIMQMAVGAFIAIGTLGGGASLAVAIFTNGFRDAYQVAQATLSGKAIDINDYLTGKAISYALIAVAAGVDKIAKLREAQNASQLANAASEAGTVGAAVTVATETITGAVTNMDIIIELTKTAGIQLVKTIAIEELTKIASNQIRENLLDGLEDRIESGIYKSALTSLIGNRSLLADDPRSTAARGKLPKDIERLCYTATKSQRSATIIKELSNGVLQAAYSHSGGAKLLHAAHVMTNTAISIDKVDRLIDNLKDDVHQLIHQSCLQLNAQKDNDARAKTNYVKPSSATTSTASATLSSSASSSNTNISTTEAPIAITNTTAIATSIARSPTTISTTPTLSQAEQLSIPLAKHISQIVASKIFAILHGSITAPLVGEGVSYAVNTCVKEFEENQREKYHAYAAKLAAQKVQQANISPLLVAAGDEIKPSIFDLFRRGESNYQPNRENSHQEPDSGLEEEQEQIQNTKPLTNEQEFDAKQWRETKMMPALIEGNPAKVILNATFTGSDLLLNTAAANYNTAGEKIKQKIREYLKENYQLANNISSGYNAITQKVEQIEAQTQQRKQYLKEHHPLAYKLIEHHSLENQLRPITYGLEKLEQGLNYIAKPIIKNVAGIEKGEVGYNSANFIATTASLGVGIKAVGLAAKTTKALLATEKLAGAGKAAQATTAAGTKVALASIEEQALQSQKYKQYLEIERQTVRLQKEAGEILGRAKEAQKTVIKVENQPTVFSPHSTFKATDDYIYKNISDTIGKYEIQAGAGGIREAAGLELKLTWRELETHTGKVMAGAGHIDPIKDIKRIIATYGGTEAEWVKMTSGSKQLNKAKFMLPEHKQMQLHWIENKITGQKIEYKFKPTK